MTTPRFTRQQRIVIESPRTTLVGVDERGRPVVRSLVGNPQREMTWAVLKNGDPADITGSVDSTDVVR